MGWDGMGWLRKMYPVLVGASEKERPVGRLACGDLVARGCELDLCGPEGRISAHQLVAVRRQEVF